MKEFKHGKITLLNCDCMDYMAGLKGKQGSSVLFENILTRR